MALFQKQPRASYNYQLYTTGLNKTLLIVGLGNVGKKYDGSRHNIGFDCVDYFAKANGFEKWTLKKDLKARLANQNLGESRVILVKPTTMMNLSGPAVATVARFYKVPASQVVLVHDELDIDFGQIRTRVGGSAAGHNGIKSVIENIGDDFSRVRIGIGPKKPESIDSADFVLQKFSKDAQKQLAELTREASAILSEWAFGGGQPIAHETRNFLI